MDLLKRLNELFVNNFGKPNSQRQKLTDPIERQAAKNTDSAALQLAATPVTAAAELAMPVLASLLTYSPEAEGAIRKGGKPSLNLTHETSVARLLEAINANYLRHPSIAIAENNGRPFAGNPSISLVMNPTYHGFDPARNPQNLLLNRDSFVTRSMRPASDFAPEFRRGQLDLRNTEGLNNYVPSLRDAAVIDRYAPPTDGQKLLSIQGSPRFTSFQEYEKSPFGAATLNPESSYAYHTVVDAIAEYDEDLLKTLYGPQRGINADLALQNLEKASKRNSEAMIALTAIKRAASDYAELKVLGDVPISPKTISAAILPDEALRNYSTTGIEDLAKELRARGIRTGTARDLMHEINPQAAMSAERLVQLLQKENAKMNFDTQSAPLSKYLGIVSDWYNNGDNLKNTFWASDALASDVASMASQRDIDLVRGMIQRNAK